jgi:cytochrome c5
MRHTKLTRATGAVIAAIVLLVAGTAYLRARPAGAEAASDGEGSRLFQEKGCMQCHHTDSTEVKIGPGLKGIMDGEELPSSGRPATRDNVRRQMIEPFRAMPSYEGRLTDEEIEGIINYLETL